MSRADDYQIVIKFTCQDVDLALYFTNLYML